MYLNGRRGPRKRNETCIPYTVPYVKLGKNKQKIFYFVMKLQNEEVYSCV